ncbi:MAG: hypothetical protein AB7F19_00445 [Candidatus Babeliales bacterium]
MKQFLKQLLSIALVTSVFAMHAMDTTNRRIYGHPYFQGRSQGENLARRLVGNAHELYRCDFDCINGVLAIIPEWSQTSNRDELGEFFSFRVPTVPNANSMSFRGSLATNPPYAPANTDVLAENFLLPSTFDGIATLKPQKQDFIADINFRLNLDEWLCGLYFEIDIPINWTRWNMHLEERPTAPQPGDIEIVASFTVTPVAPFVAEAPVETIIEAWRGNTNGQLSFLSSTTTLAPNPISITIQEMIYGKLDGSQSKAGVADLNFILGYNFFCNDCYHFGANLRATAPTGTRPDAKYLFEPIVGNGRHTTLGLGLNGHAILWENGCDQSFSLWFDSAVYHLFNAKQTRTFDLIGNGVGSRYLLFKRFAPDEDDVPQFTGTLVPGPNVTTIETKVKINVAGEAVLMFDYQRCGFTFDVGYGIWGRSKEKITATSSIEPRTFGLLGGTPIDNDVPNSDDPNPNLPANRTNSTVRINGQNASAVGDGPADAPAVPVFISVADLDLARGAAPSALSHKVFTHLGYTWEGCDYSPFFGVGGEVEFSGKHNSAFNQWGVWAKGGFAFS